MHSESEMTGTSGQKRKPPRTAGQGRPKGQVNKRTLARTDVAMRALNDGITPLEFLLARMRAPMPKREDFEDERAWIAKLISWDEDTKDAAKAAAPYVHPKLSNVDAKVQGELSIQLVDFSKESSI